MFSKFRLTSPAGNPMVMRSSQISSQLEEKCRPLTRWTPRYVPLSVIMNLVIESMAAKVNTNSAKLLSGLNRELKRLPIKSSCRKEFRACTATKIQFGQNFVDKGTPLVIEDFCINQTVSLLLLT
ncbi:hypothetical protein Fcan01_00139 [Folsomia candida]|uniref:Uncharacterized protein n=1 Tax=Folsomia candida TaxID=158441 RepID=A0A226F184_FOLCA|nr:hypothetical protein Fcan01_00139 [Folsomia candida]